MISNHTIVEITAVLLSISQRLHAPKFSELVQIQNFKEKKIKSSQLDQAKL